eukprot:139809_1
MAMENSDTQAVALQSVRTRLAKNSRPTLLSMAKKEGVNNVSSKNRDIIAGKMIDKGYRDDVFYSDIAARNNNIDDDENVNHNSTEEQDNDEELEEEVIPYEQEQKQQMQQMMEVDVEELEHILFHIDISSITLSECDQIGYQRFRRAVLKHD